MTRARRLPWLKCALFLAAAVWLTSAWLEAQSTPPSGVISGRLLDARTGVPIAGATIDLTPLAELTTIGGETAMILVDAALAQRRGRRCGRGR